VRFFYTLLACLLAPVFLVYLYWRGVSSPGYRQRIGERFGRCNIRVESPSIWVHAVSVGEVQAAESLVRALREAYPDRPLIMTTMTPTGSERVRSLFGESVAHCYLPYDLPGVVRKFLDAARPALAIILETELWPNLYRECDRRGVPLVLANARISPRSIGRYRFLSSLIADTLSRGVVIAAQSESDAERFRQLGSPAECTHVTGNIKFDFQVAPGTVERGRAFRLEHAANRPVWIAASTHVDEEQTVVAVHRKVIAVFPDALLLIVPRHPERFASVASMLEGEGFPFVTRSSGQACVANTQVFVGDSMGELMMYYAASDLAFVGGSLQPVGGHNLLEPAAFGLPVLTGPYNFNTADVVKLLQVNDAAKVVADSEELTEQIIMLLKNSAERERRGAAGLAVVKNNRGTLRRLMDLIDPLVK
jgi:3-deoxy-D-manno-octulosonic-acid transferase